MVFPLMSQTPLRTIPIFTRFSSSGGFATLQDIIGAAGKASIFYVYLCTVGWGELPDPPDHISKHPPRQMALGPTAARNSWRVLCQATAIPTLGSQGSSHRDARRVHVQELQSTIRGEQTINLFDRGRAGDKRS